jgi:NAD-dependent DNA ligase
VRKKKYFTVCFTGKMKWPRSHMFTVAQCMGHTPVNSVTKKTDLLVLADFRSLSVKARRARRNGTRLLTEDAFLNLPMKKSAKEINEYIDIHMFSEMLEDYTY